MLIMNTNWDHKLTQEQVSATSHTGSHARLLAGPGTGKTLVLTRRVLYLIRECNVPPDGILVLTFTRAASRELQQRIVSEIGENANGIAISTLHSFALRTLLQHGAGRRLPQPIRIADDWEERHIIEEDLKTLCELSRIEEARDRLKQLSADWEQLEADKDNYRFLDPKFYGAWQEHRQIFGYTLRAELVYQLMHSLEEGIVQLDQIQKHILVDEYQDLNPCDLAVVKALATAGAKLYVAGDDDQSIYGFRFAEPEGIRRFPDEYTPAKSLTLEECQRCSSRILDIATYVAQQDIRRVPKALRSVQGASPGEVQILHFPNQYKEAEGIAQICRWLIHTRTLKPEDILILARSDHNRGLSKPIREKFEEVDVPVGITANPLECVNNDESRIFLSILRLVVDGQDNLAWRTLLRRRKNGIGETKLRDVYELARSRGDNFAKIIFDIAEEPSLMDAGLKIAKEFIAIQGEVEKAKSIIDAKGLSEGINTLIEQFIVDDSAKREVMDLFRRITGTVAPVDLSELLRAINVSLGNREQEQQAGSVNIMTMHQAKGLTATAVFIVGAEDEYIPGRAKGKEIDDERRLLYVSLTRARQYLFITHCRNRIDQQSHSGRNPGVARRSLTKFLSGGPVKSEDGGEYISGLI
jgi:DNA helicase-2/ATP-dependent DNA helicase PcrA